MIKEPRIGLIEYRQFGDIMNKKDKRAYIRIPLIVGWHCMIDQKSYPIADIANNGLFLKDDDLRLNLKSNYQISIELPGDLGNFKFNCKVVRCVLKGNEKKSIYRGYGIEFILSDNEQKIMDSYVVYLRNKQIISVSKRIIEEFFGNTKERWKE
jgi:hypothetical protein